MNVLWDDGGDGGCGGGDAAAGQPEDSSMLLEFAGRSAGRSYFFFLSFLSSLWQWRIEIE